MMRLFSDASSEKEKSHLLRGMKRSFLVFEMLLSICVTEPDSARMRELVLVLVGVCRTVKLSF